MNHICPNTLALAQYVRSIDNMLVWIEELSTSINPIALYDLISIQWNLKFSSPKKKKNIIPQKPFVLVLALSIISSLQFFMNFYSHTITILPSFYFLFFPSIFMYKNVDILKMCLNVKNIFNHLFYIYTHTYTYKDLNLQSWRLR